jgi:hypothetical protein
LSNKIDLPGDSTPKKPTKHYSVMLFAGNKKVSIPLVDTGQRIEKKNESGKYRSMILQVLKGIKPHGE